MVVKASPAFDDDLGFPCVAEPFPVQALVSELSMEALNIAVLPRAAWGDERRSDVLVSEPAHDSCCSELSSIVTSDVLRLAVDFHQPRERQNHVLRSDPPSYLDSQALASVFVENAQQLECRSVGKSIVDKVIRPDRVGVHGAWQADVRACTTPSSLRRGSCSPSIRHSRRILVSPSCSHA